MAATLTADPNPVGLWDPTGTKDTHIEWNTDSNNRGKVYLRIDGVDQGQVDGGDDGDFDGDFNYPIQLGKTYVFILRRAGGNQAVLATLTVTAYDLQKELRDQTVGAILFANQLDPPQAIYGLVVSPGIDTVRVSFRTRRPTVPHVTISTVDGEQVVSWFPFFGGLQTRHVLEFGAHRRLAQGTRHRLRINVPGRKPLLGPAQNVVRTVEFVTGTRVVDVLFDEIKVLKDGDTGLFGGSGEFRFTFVAADAEGSGDDQVFRSFDRDIDQDGPAVQVDLSIPLAAGPREVWVQVAGMDRDPPEIEAFLVDEHIYRPTVPTTGTGPLLTHLWQGAWVARIFDVSGAEPGFRTMPFQMETGEFDVAFNVKGRIVTKVQPGLGWWMIPVDYRPAKFKMAVLKEPGSKGTMSGKHGAGTLVALDAEGRIWLRSIDPERPEPRHEGWSTVAPAPGGAVTGLRLDDGRVELFGLAADGSAQRWIPGGGGREGGWRPLGGTFSGALAAVEEPEGGVALFGVGADGRVRQRTLGAGEQDEWEDLGGAIAGGLRAVELPGHGTALFAIDREGRVVHRTARRDGHPDWRPLGGPRAGWLVAQPAKDGGIMVVVLAEDGLVHRLLWRDHPHGDPERGWEELGPLEALMPLQPLPARGVREPDDEIKAVRPAG